MESFKSDKLDQRILILKLVPVFGLIINYLNISGKGVNSLGIVTAAKKKKKRHQTQNQQTNHPKYNLLNIEVLHFTDKKLTIIKN